LPPTWAAAFFAALAVLIGHFIYQMGAPDLVRQNSLSQFVSGRLDEYAKYRSESAMRRAQSFSSVGSGDRTAPEKSGPFGASVPSPDEALRTEMTAIEQGAVAEYSFFAERNVAAILCSTACYLAALALIAWIIVRQTHSVGAAAGWLE
jgi:hypothetical protein